MAQPYVGEIRIFAGNFAPAGWMLCDGQLLPISEYETLFTLIGTTYGGDGQETFALPDLRGRIPLHQGNAFTLAETGGVETVTLTTQQIPAHSHPLLGTSAAATSANPAGRVLAEGRPGEDLYLQGASVTTTPLAPTSIGVAGGSQPHSNFQPYACVNYIISFFGIFPSPN